MMEVQSALTSLSETQPVYGTRFMTVRSTFMNSLQDETTRNQENSSRIVLLNNVGSSRVLQDIKQNNREKFKRAGDMLRRLHAETNISIEDERKSIEESYWQMNTIIGNNLELLVNEKGLSFSELLIILRTRIRPELTIQSTGSISEEFLRIGREYYPYWWNEKALLDIIKLTNEIVEKNDQDTQCHYDNNSRISPLNKRETSFSAVALVQEMADIAKKYTERVNDFFTDHTVQYIDVESPIEKSIAIVCFDVKHVNATAISELYSRATEALSATKSKRYYVLFWSLEKCKEKEEEIHMYTKCQQEVSGYEKEIYQEGSDYLPFLNTFPNTN